MLALIIISIIILMTMGHLLVRVDHVEKSDVIIVLSGFDGRLEHGINLFKEGYGDYLMLSNSDDFDEEVLQ
ncbi:MAG TPA: hypothetical protein GXZ58_01115 [Bacilli bacterium]|nr:hypothetical protein [Bacilli bacterium]